MEEIKYKILSEYEDGNIVFSDFEGLNIIPLKELINQSADEILYDLNRQEVVVLTFLPDPKWINDYAVAKVIRALKDKIDELENNSKPNKNKYLTIKEVASKYREELECKFYDYDDEWKTKKMVVNSAFIREMENGTIKDCKL